jgi:hypothetical protein
LEDLFKGQCIPWVGRWGVRFGSVYDSPIVVVVFVGVEGDLLFCSSATGFNMNEAAYVLIRWDRRERGNVGIHLGC